MGTTYVANSSSGNTSASVCVCVHVGVHGVLYVCHVYAMQTHTQIISDNHRASNLPYVLYNEDKENTKWIHGVCLCAGTHTCQMCACS